MGRLRILVHAFCDSSETLVEALTATDCKRSHLHHTKYVPNAADLVVNWGCIVLPEMWHGKLPGTFLNHPDLVRTSTKRTKSLKILKEAGINVPKVTVNAETAKQWLLDGHTVIARAKVRSYAGKGITVCEPADYGESVPVPEAALYTRYIPKRHEYRVHVFRGKVIDVQQKKKRNGFDGEVDYKVRSYANGWALCRNGVTVPDICQQESIRAVAALGLDFGATDVGWTESTDKATIYEVNTAPAMDGPTLSAKYAEAIRKVYDSL
jgi:glutathione synthase/RimK-type ligase-like ATP-grasp enzyme